METKQLRILNTQLAASAQQDVRDIALNTLVTSLCKEHTWVAEPTKKNLRIIWEGLFFMFWHADKSVYQRDTALKISSIQTKLIQTGDSEEN